MHGYMHQPLWVILMFLDGGSKMLDKLVLKDRELVWQSRIDDCIDLTNKRNNVLKFTASNVVPMSECIHWLHVTVVSVTDHSAQESIVCPTEEMSGPGA